MNILSFPSSTYLPLLNILNMAEVTDNNEHKWIPLEANPELIHLGGVDPKWNYVDIYGFEPELLSMIPQPVKAIIFLFPITEAYEKFKLEEEIHLSKYEQNISPKVIFFKQTIQNACGMMALLHSVATNEELLGPGLFNDIIQKADQHLYELDGRKIFPINHGKSTNLIESSVKVMKQYMARDPTETNFSAIALCEN
ncbi:hypothetical protein BDB01DRAFT_3755 [Pilobolus umbonatus]|nr:hypothetical protein BDB01DRAFT_3755 [Pilobolus umbonatus]